jgi:ABC-2 type transport system ATP-binding protein
MRQRLGIAAAMLGDPPIVMLDEPFNGLDPEGIVWMRGLLTRLAAQGRAILVSSHLMSELQDIASHLVVVGRGTVITEAPVAELLAAASGDRVTLHTSARLEATSVLTHAGATVVSDAPEILTVSGISSERIIALLTGSGVSFSELSAHRATLEEAYMELTREAAEFRAPVTGEPVR